MLYLGGALGSYQAPVVVGEGGQDLQPGGALLGGKRAVGRVRQVGGLANARLDGAVERPVAEHHGEKPGGRREVDREEAGATVLDRTLQDAAFAIRPARLVADEVEEQPRDPPQPVLVPDAQLRDDHVPDKRRDPGRRQAHVFGGTARLRALLENRALCPRQMLARVQQTAHIPCLICTKR